jgi:hypothetical protein
MSTFCITKPNSFKGFSFGKRLIDIVTVLSLPTPFINGSEMTKFHKKGVWFIHITQPGRETELKTEKIKFKTFHANKKAGAHLLMQELIARLCRHHFSELQNQYSHPYGRRDEEGLAIGLSDSEQDPMRIHLAKLEYLVRDVDVERYNELFNNDELRAQLPRRTNNTWSRNRGSRRWRRSSRLKRSNERAKIRGSKPRTKKLES